jgi:hypothetical protein
MTPLIYVNVFMQEGRASVCVVCSQPIGLDRPCTVKDTKGWIGCRMKVSVDLADLYCMFNTIFRYFKGFIVLY